MKTDGVPIPCAGKIVATPASAETVDLPLVPVLVSVDDKTRLSHHPGYHVRLSHHDALPLTDWYPVRPGLANRLSVRLTASSVHLNVEYTPITGPVVDLAGVETTRLDLHDDGQPMGGSVVIVPTDGATV